MLPVLYKDDQVEKLIAIGPEPQVDVELPLGPAYNDYRVALWARISDNLGAVTTFHIGDVQVRCLSLVYVVFVEVSVVTFVPVVVHISIVDIFEILVFTPFRYDLKHMNIVTFIINSAIHITTSTHTHSVQHINMSLSYLVKVNILNWGTVELHMIVVYYSLESRINSIIWYTKCYDKSDVLNIMHACVCYGCNKIVHFIYTTLLLWLWSSTIRLWFLLSVPKETLDPTQDANM